MPTLFMFSDHATCCWPAGHLAQASCDSAMMAGLAASPPLANAGVNGCPGVNRPAVPVVTNAVVGQENRRKRKLEVSSDAVTDAELGQAVVREVTAALQLVPAPVPAPAAGGAPPAWAAPMVANIATLTANVATLTANVATLTASNANQRRCSRNAAAIRRDVDGAGPQPVEMLCKELPGFGVLPAGALPPPVLAAHPPHPGPAVFPPPALHQPATTRISLTGQQISFLQCWYNDTFGIVAGDAVRAQRGAQLETLNFQVRGGNWDHESSCNVFVFCFHSKGATSC